MNLASAVVHEILVNYEVVNNLEVKTTKKLVVRPGRRLHCFVRFENVMQLPRVFFSQVIVYYKWNTFSFMF